MGLGSDILDGFREKRLPLNSEQFEQPSYWWALYHNVPLTCYKVILTVNQTGIVTKKDEERKR